MSHAMGMNLNKDGTDTRSVDLVPQKNAWATLSAGAVVPIGLAIAAAVSTWLTDSERVAITAWVAVAVVGTASVISAAAASRRRTRHVHEEDQKSRTKTTEPLQR